MRAFNLIYTESFLNFIIGAWQDQLQTGQRYEECIFKSNEYPSPTLNFGKLKLEVEELILTGSKTALTRKAKKIMDLICIVDELGAKMTKLPKNGEYFVYTYGDETFGYLFSAPNSRYKFRHNHNWCSIIEYFRDVYAYLNKHLDQREQTAPEAPDNGRQTKKKTPVELPEMFADKSNLERLVALLKEKKFVDSTGTWTGIESDKAPGRGFQLVVCAFQCQDYLRARFQDKQMYYAWTTYFNYKLAESNFRENQRKTFSESYARLFNFIRQELK